MSLQQREMVHQILREAPFDLVVRRTPNARCSSRC